MQPLRLASVHDTRLPTVRGGLSHCAPSCGAALRVSNETRAGQIETIQRSGRAILASRGRAACIHQRSLFMAFEISPSGSNGSIAPSSEADHKPGGARRAAPAQSCDLRRNDPKFQEPRFSQYLSAVASLDRYARERYGLPVLALAVRWELGHGVRVWNRTVDNANDAREAGARWTPTLGELVNDSQVVISFLFDDAAVERVYLGIDGLLTGRVEGCLFIDMSTVSPGTHERIASAMASRNAGFIECPVSGSIPTALSGALVGFAGGEAPEFARAQPLLG